MHTASPNTTVFPMSYHINPNTGMAHLGAVSMETIAKQVGTPTYLLDEMTLSTMMKTYVDAFSSYPGKVQVLFAAKANLSMGLCALVEKAGLGLDVVSGGEYYTALKAGFPLDKILFNGNNKSRQELTLAIHHGLGWLSVDNFHELSLANDVAKNQQKQVPILLRVTPGIECHTHEYIKTGHLDSKFGFGLSQLDEALEWIQTHGKNNLNLLGLHAHIGSQIFETLAYHDLVDVMLNQLNHIRLKYGITCTHLDLGGGLGIAYQDSDNPPDVTAYATIIINEVVSVCKQLDYPLPTLLLEPGRSLVATAGATLYTVGSFKTVPELSKTYVAVDGGMGDNIRPALYGAQYSAVVANKANEPHTKPVTIAGKYCESGDILIHHFLAPESIAPGDLLLVFGTGAYNYSMASNYNRVPKPGMLLIQADGWQTLIKPQTYDDLIAQDLMP